MPIVFVHGVNNRSDNYEHAIPELKALFRTVCLPRTTIRKDIKIFTPYWGGLGANPTHGNQFLTLPSSGYESFGGPPEYPELLTRDLVQVIGTQPDTPLLATARAVSLSCAIDLLWTCSTEQTRDPKSLEDMGRFIADAFQYADLNSTPRWVNEVSNDTQFVLKLKEQVEATRPQIQAEDAYGVGDWLGYLISGAGRVREFAQKTLFGIPRRVGSQTGLFFLRPWMTNIGARTVGDALVYFANRGSVESPGNIMERVLDDVRKAHLARQGEEPLIAIGHSLGGVILYDLFNQFDSNLQCDLLVTVGSQVGFFQELGILSGNKEKAKRPRNVQRWLNVFDSVDVLSFCAQPMFQGVIDYAYSNETGALSAHTSYFWSPRFHRRLGTRIDEVLRGGTR